MDVPGLRAPDYPRDPRTFALFRKATGQTPDSASEAWKRWHTAQITQVARDIRAMLRKVKPAVVKQLHRARRSSQHFAAFAYN